MHAGKSSSSQLTTPGFHGEGFQHLVSRFYNVLAGGAEPSALLRDFCQEGMANLGADGVQCWEFTPDNRFRCFEAGGHRAESARGSVISASELLASDSVRARKAVYLNSVDQTRFPLAGVFGAKSLLSAPIVSGTDVIGAVTWFSSQPSFFSDQAAAQAEALAIALGSLMRVLRLVSESTEMMRCAEQQRRRADDLMALSLELNSSLLAPDFLSRFTVLASEMLNARVAAFASFEHSHAQFVGLSDPSAIPANVPIYELNAALVALMRRTREPISEGDAAQLLGEAAAAHVGWRDLTLIRLNSTNGEIVGALLLVDRGKELSAEERSLLHSLAKHAAVALENSGLFARMEQANRHWIEIFDSITDFIVVHDESHNILRVNRSLASFIGARPQDLIGLNIRAVLAMPGSEESNGCPFCRLGEDDEYVHTGLDRTYLVSNSRIESGTHNGYQTIHVLKDITDRREAERRYRELFDNIQEGLFFSSPDGRFVEVNDALVRMFGYSSREELLKADVASNIYLSQEQHERFCKQLEENGSLRNYEETLRRLDGSLLYTLQNAFAVKDSQGRVVQYRGLMLDITELKSFQSELQRERDFSSKILNNTQSMILVADTAGLISYANRRCYEGGHFNESDLLGNRLANLVAPTRVDAMRGAFEATLEGQQVDNLELPFVLGNGHIAHFSINMSPMRDEQGNVTSIVVVMTDVTDSALLQAKLMHTEKMAAVGQLVSGVAHEVNNPLTAVLGFTDLLLEHPDLPVDARSDLQIILQEAQRTKTIVQNLLSFARQTPPQRELCNVNEVLRRTIALRAYDFNNHNVKIDDLLDDAIPHVMADSHQLQQVFLNILNNAYDAVMSTGGTGRIQISTSFSRGFVEVGFCDNGPGVTNPERIFDPFFTTKEVGKGTGLGLSICYGIVHEHGGEIACSNNEDRGATFVVRLPVTAAVQAASAGTRK